MIYEMRTTYLGSLVRVRCAKGSLVHVRCAKGNGSETCDLCDMQQHLPSLVCEGHIVCQRAIHMIYAMHDARLVYCVRCAKGNGSETYDLCDVWCLPSLVRVRGA